MPPLESRLLSPHPALNVGPEPGREKPFVKGCYKTYVWPSCMTENTKSRHTRRYPLKAITPTVTRNKRRGSSCDTVCVLGTPHIGQYEITETTISLYGQTHMKVGDIATKITHPMLSRAIQVTVCRTVCVVVTNSRRDISIA